MKQIHTKQLALSMMVAAILVTAVLLWGTTYKCSLYHKHPQKHARVAVAKLLSERERPAPADQATVVRAPLSHAIFFTIGLLLFGIARAQRRSAIRNAASLRSGARSPRLRGCVSYFSSRPPPSLA